MHVLFEGGLSKDILEVCPCVPVCFVPHVITSLASFLHVTPGAGWWCWCFCFRMLCLPPTQAWHRCMRHATLDGLRWLKCWLSRGQMFVHRPSMDKPHCTTRSSVGSLRSASGPTIYVALLPSCCWIPECQRNVLSFCLNVSVEKKLEACNYSITVLSTYNGREKTQKCNCYYRLSLYLD